MIECPWCQHTVNIVNGRCENCKSHLHEVSKQDFSDLHMEDEHSVYMDDMNIEEIIRNNFRCKICNGKECRIKEVAMTGTGLSKFLDIQHNHYLFVSCENCAKVDIYNPDILREKKSGNMGTIIDILFGG